MTASSNHSATFSPIHKEERARLGLLRPIGEADGIGLALSGGGIRSASFSLGVVQLLLNEDLLQRVDYLSTVSGGGYVGSSITWWLHQATERSPDLQDGLDTYQAFRQQFGSKVLGARTRLAASFSSKSPWLRSNWLAFIRQHGNYLQPRGVGYIALAAPLLRICLFSLIIYSAALVGLFCLVRAVETQGKVPAVLQLACIGPLFGDACHRQLLTSVGITVAAFLSALLAAASWLYGLMTWLTSGPRSGAQTVLYEMRSRFRAYSGALLSWIIWSLLVVSIEPAYESLRWLWARVLAVAGSLTLGSIGTAYQFLKGRAQSKSPSWVSHARLIATSGFVIYGLVIASYGIALKPPNPLESGLWALGLSAGFGLFVNTNFSGLARLYRDRLMEAFLPNLDSVANNRWKLAETANVQKMADLKGRLKKDQSLVQADPAHCPRPLHIVNCNAVLMDSCNDLFRNRGGDSFFISPLWSGSNATGWCPTPRLGDGAMTLATAMSISGAAANPNAAPNGLGVTRNRFVSFLMSLFSIRLGYWMANPALNITEKKPSNRPNLWFPGFRQGLLGSGLSEAANFIELTDGGHFDNTALYELIRRRTKLIIVAQAGADPEFAMEDLANAIEKVRVDFSVFIEFNDETLSLDALRATGEKRFEQCKRGWAIGRIRYPLGTPASPEYEDGYLIYLQAVPAATLSADLASYWRRHAEFPNDTTADQFFTEQNVEAYRELGYAIASSFYRDLKAKSAGVPTLGEIAQLLSPSLLKERRSTHRSFGQTLMSLLGGLLRK
jgi:predicted acylesterase/phospholipase RssA